MNRGLSPLRSGHDSGAEATPWERLRGLLRLERADVASVLVYGAAVGVGALAIPISVQALVNSVAFTALLQPVLVLASLTLLAVLAAGAARTLQAQIVETLVQRVFVRTAHEFAERLTQTPRDALVRAGGDSVARKFFEVVIIQKSLASLLVDGVSLALEAAIAIVLLSLYHPMLLALGLLLIAGLSVVIFGLGRAGPPTAIKESKAKYAVADALATLGAIPGAFAAPHVAQAVSAHLDRLSAAYVVNRQKHFGVVRRQIIGGFILQAVALALLLGLGGALVVDGQLSLGQLVASELVLATVLSGVIKLGKHLETTYDLLASLDKLGHVVDLPTEPPGALALENTRDLRVTLTDITLTDRSPTPLIEVPRFELRTGQVVACTGSSAEARHALAAIFAGRRIPTTGVVKINEIPLSSVSKAQWHSVVGVVSTPHLLVGTVLDNLRLGAPPPAAEAVAEALAVSGLTEHVARWPEGLSQPIGPDDELLSPAETAQLALARAWLRTPALLVLDGTLDGLDLSDATRIATALQARSSQLAVLVLTSRPDVASLFSRRWALTDPASSMETP